MLLSIIIPTYNSQDYIINQCYSLLKINNPSDLEVIFVDDGSKDKTVALIKEFIDRNYPLTSSWKVYSLAKNSGVSFARNFGFSKAKGSYIVYLDADDFLNNQILDIIRINVNEYNPDIICWKFTNVDAKLTPIANQFNFSGILKGKIYSGLEVLKEILINKSFWVRTGNMAISRSIIARYHLKYPKEFNSGEDLYFNYLALFYAEKVIFVDENLLFYVQRENTLSTQYSLKRLESYFALNLLSDVLPNQNDTTLILKRALKEKADYDFVSQFGHLSWVSKLKVADYIKQVELSYPGLIKRIRREMKLFKQTVNWTMKDYFKLLLFKLTPRLYALISKFYYHYKHNSNLA